MYREASLYGHSIKNPAIGLKTPAIQISEKKFLTWEEVDSKSWGRYDEQIRFLALHGLRWSEAAVIQESDIRDGFVFISKSFAKSCRCFGVQAQAPDLHASVSGTKWSTSNWDAFVTDLLS
jgi:hypothetical protein